MEDRKILVTGASGFIGINYFNMSMFKNNLHRSVVRHETIDSIILTNIESIIHLAGKAHEMGVIEDEIYFKANRDLAFDLAKRAKLKGVKQFIYLSSVKVYGKDSSEIILDENTPCQPNDAYGKSKLEAEQKLLTLQDISFTVSIIRPPLVYGAHVKGNMIKLLTLANSSKPLPFGNINNHRSMVFVGNLVALIDVLIEKKISGIFIAGDEKPISTTYLLQTIRQKMSRPLRLFGLPKFVLWILKEARPDLIKRLFYSFVTDTNKTNQKLKFKPPYTTAQGIEYMVKWYRHFSESK